MEIFAALTGKSLGFVEDLETQTIADFLKLPSRWHLQICDVNKVVLLDSHLAKALQAAHEEGVVSAGFETDKQVVLAAVKQKGKALQDASVELRGDPEIVMAAVKQNGMALFYASKKLHANPEIVLAAKFQDRRALKYASADLERYHKIVVAAVKQES
jgi:hypothetical protein